MKSSELKKYIEENIIEILDEANALVVTKTGGTKVVPIINPTELNPLKADANVTSITTTAGQKIKETKDEDEEVEDTYGKEDEDDKKDAKIKDAKPTKSDLKKNASIATITDALAKVTKEFKEVTEKYKKAEGEEKAKFLAKLKDLTPKIQTLKKALEKKEKALK
jgi:hypothetical protein